MSTLPSHFIDFLKEVRLTPTQQDEAKSGHETLRDRLMNYDDLKFCIITTFLQGSYKRATALRPFGEQKSDIDIVVVTNLDQKDYPNPAVAINKFLPFVEKYYSGKYDNTQGRSIGIELSEVKMDLVITSAPSEVENKLLKSNFINIDNSIDEIDFDKVQLNFNKGTDWKLEPLWIPDREAKIWQQTHPLAQIIWTIEKNNKTNGHYINVIKALKWWQRITVGMPEYPKSYPFEHLLGDCCPDNINSVAEGITLSLETLINTFGSYAHSKVTPVLKDRGVDQNVLSRITGEDFAKFYNKAKEAANLARQALDYKNPRESSLIWIKLLGDKFSEADDEGEGSKGGYTPRSSVSQPARSTFA